jgi:hypothetical protein
MINKIVNLVVKLIGEERLLYFLSSKQNKRFLSLKKWGYLSDEGWILSDIKKESIDKNGNPIPWFSYPMNDFLDKKLTQNLSILEYGAGNSTRYFKDKVKMIISIESNEHWYKIVSEDLSQCNNVKIYFEPLENGSIGYIEKPKELNRKFDIIIIDGMHRKECLTFSLDYLSEKGVLIVDDTNNESEIYDDYLEKLTNRDFRRLDFCGMSPYIVTKKCTTVLYRDGNCLGI